MNRYAEPLLMPPSSLKGEPIKAWLLLSAIELQNLEPDLSDSDNTAIQTVTLQAIEQQPALKTRLLAALEAGTLTAAEEFSKHPLAKVAISAFKAAFTHQKKI